MRIGYSTDIDTIFGQYADVECVLSVSRNNDAWAVDGVYVRQFFGGRERLMPVSVNNNELSARLASAILDNAERDLTTPGSKLLADVEEAASFEEAA